MLLYHCNSSPLNSTRSARFGTVLFIVHRHILYCTRCTVESSIAKYNPSMKNSNCVYTHVKAFRCHRFVFLQYFGTIHVPFAHWKYTHTLVSRLLCIVQMFASTICHPSYINCIPFGVCMKNRLPCVLPVCVTMEFSCLILNAQRAACSFDDHSLKRSHDGPDGSFVAFPVTVLMHAPNVKLFMTKNQCELIVVQIVRLLIISCKPNGLQ